MFHVPAHKSTTAAQAAILNAHVDCPRCGGYPELDETGRPYTCYCCCDTGSVTLDFAFEEYAERVAYDAANPPPAPYVAPARAAVELFDDIPF